jgi:hypothetical protein
MTQPEAEQLLQRYWPSHIGSAEFEGGIYRVSLMPFASEGETVVNSGDWPIEAESQESFEEAIKLLAEKQKPDRPLPG